MARVFSENGYTGQVWPNDHDPPHVHVFKDDGEVVIALSSISVMRSYGLSIKELRHALELAYKHQDAAWKKWREFHGD